MLHNFSIGHEQTDLDRVCYFFLPSILYFLRIYLFRTRLSSLQQVLCRMPAVKILPVHIWQHSFVSPSAFSRRAVVSYWRKYVHEVLVNRLGGLSLPRKSVVRLTDRPDMTLDVYRGRKTTMQQQQHIPVHTERKKN